MSKVTTTVYIDREVLETARKYHALLGYRSVSQLVERLLREWAKREVPDAEVG